VSFEGTLNLLKDGSPSRV